jgi:hypothetical protein
MGESTAKRLCLGGLGAVEGILIVVMDTTAQEGRLPVGPAQWMDQQSFAGVEREESIDGQRRWDEWRRWGWRR